MKKNLKRLLLRFILISIPAVMWVSWQFMMPLNQYTFRAWEALIDESKLKQGPFYANQTLDMIEVGDLTPYTTNAITKKVHWKIDEEGYRNENSTCVDPAIVVLGDSVAVGTSLTQSETLTAQLEQTLSARKDQAAPCVRSFAGGKLNRALQTLYRLQLHPKLVVIALIERQAGALMELKSLDQKDQPILFPRSLQKLGFLISRFQKHLYWNFRAAHGVGSAVSRSFHSPEKNLSQVAPERSSQDSAAGSSVEMSFFDSRFEFSEEMTEQDLKTILAQLNRLASELSARQAKLIITFVPNKVSVYYKLKGRSKPQFNERFLKLLSTPPFAPQFTYLDLITHFQKEYDTRGTLYHHLDDSHWNALGVRELVNLALKELP